MKRQRQSVAKAGEMGPADAMRIKVLIVDDDRLVLASLAEGLTHAGYEVLCAACGADAVKICCDELPDLVIMDVRMPGMSGVEAARRIREQTGTPVFFLSAFDDQETVRAAVGEGGLGYLVKPVRINQLVTSIRAALARAAELSALKTTEENLKTALRGDRNIGLAAGVFMERHHMSAIAAFELLRRRARSERRKLSEIAAEVVDAAEKINLPRA